MGTRLSSANSHELSAQAPPSYAPARCDEEAQLAKPILPDRLPTVRYLDPAAALAYRTPIQEHLLSADSKAAGVLTLLGIMFTIIARYGATLGELLNTGGPLRSVCLGLLVAFAALSLGAVIQAFRTISPRFPKSPPSLAFFGDIARLSREEYIARVEELNPATALENMLTFNHTAAQICVEKFRQLRRGLLYFEAAALCYLPLVIILCVRALLS